MGHLLLALKARKAEKGFTLAELLIALAILGVIATFTIPKVLNSASSGQNTAIAKEAASMVSGAFSSYQLNNTISSGTTAGLLTSYMNYVAVDTATTYDAGANQLGTKLQACSATLVCLKLHNGGILQYDGGGSFGANSTGAIYFNVDPDGSGVQGAVTFVQYKTGRLTTGATANSPADSTDTSGTTITKITTDPTYLQNWN